LQKYVILGIFYYGDNMLKKIIKLILIVFWMGLIFSFSADSGKVSTGKSDGLIIRVVETIMGRELNDSEKEKWIDYLVVPVRKGAHLFVYLVLGVLVISFLKEFMIVNYKVLLLAVFISFLYACSDEIHQMLVPGRSGQISDVLLDAVGSSIGIIFYYLIYKKKLIVTDKV
jgi:VanZ family protein